MPAAYKLTVLLKRRADLDADSFADAWLEVDRGYPPIAPGLERYVFNRRVSGPHPIADLPSAPYDAVIETWWRRKNDAADWVVSHAFENGWLGRRRAMLAERPAAVAGQPVVGWERPLTDEMSPVTVFTLPVARRNLRLGEFSERWVGVYSGLVLASPVAQEGIVRCELTPALLGAPSRFERTRFDGVSAVTFVSAEALVAAYDSEHRRTMVVPGERDLVDPVFSGRFIGTPVDLT